MLQLSQSAQTVMIHDLAACFANAQYAGLVDVLNQTMAKEIIQAPDVAFIKTSDLVQAAKKELSFPKGFISSLNYLNSSTASNISNNEILQYNTRENQFISSDGQSSSKELNIISSGKDVLKFSTGEIFTEEELINFSSFLSRTPMLGGTSETGKKIYDLIAITQIVWMWMGLSLRS